MADKYEDILIQGEMVILREVTVKKIISLEELKAKLVPDDESTLPLTPLIAHTVALNNSRNGSILIFRHAEVLPKMTADSDEVFNILFPDRLYHIKMASVPEIGVFSWLNDGLLRTLPLPNTYDSGLLCFKTELPKHDVVEAGRAFKRIYEHAFHAHNNDLLHVAKTVVRENGLGNVSSSKELLKLYAELTTSDPKKMLSLYQQPMLVTTHYPQIIKAMEEYLS